MIIPGPIRWPSTYKGAVAAQGRLRRRLVTTGSATRLRLVAGADVSYSKATDRVYAGVLVLSFPDLEVVEIAVLADKARFPYIPGLLTFREGPLLTRVFRRLHATPDVVIFDGQGYAHPRRMGLASHMGIVLGLPSVGCAKSRLIGEHDEPGPLKGDWTPLRDGGEVIGRVLRTRAGVKPVYVSVGHKLGPSAAARVVLECLKGYRLPEPTRLAHQLVNRFRREDTC